MVLDEAIQQEGLKEKTIMEAIYENIHVATPGIIVSFIPGTWTADIQHTILNLMQAGNPPFLKDVPILFFERFVFDVHSGDDCLVFFADGCVDAWKQSGTVSTPITPRHHDLSDAFAIIGFWSQPKATQIIPLQINLKDKLDEIDGRLENLENDVADLKRRVSSLEGFHSGGE